MTDKSADDIILCLDGARSWHLESRNILERNTDDCDTVAKAIRKIGWMSNPDRLPSQSLDPGWPYPAPTCDVARAVQAIYVARFRKKEEEFRQKYAAEQREKEARDERLLQRWIDGVKSRADADMARIAQQSEKAIRVREAFNGFPGVIDEPEIEIALVALFQNVVSDDRLLLDRGFLFFSPVLGLYGSASLASVSDVSCEMPSPARAECTLRANTDRQIDMTRLYGTSEQGQAWAKLAQAAAPMAYSTDLRLAFVHDGTGWWVERISQDALSRMIEGPRMEYSGDRAPCIAFSAVDILMNC
jgi:hypothetical protein